jgi:hypothetical protein
MLDVYMLVCTILEVVAVWMVMYFSIHLVCVISLYCKQLQTQVLIMSTILYSEGKGTGKGKDDIPKTKLNSMV